MTLQEAIDNARARQEVNVSTVRGEHFGWEYAIVGSDNDLAFEALSEQQAENPNVVVTNEGTSRIRVMWNPEAFPTSAPSGPTP